MIYTDIDYTALFDDSTPTIDSTVHLDNISKYTKYDLLYTTLQNIVKTQRNTLSMFLDEQFNPAFEKVYNYLNNNYHLYTSGLYDNSGEQTSFDDSRILFPLNEFGLYDEDSYVLSVFVKGLKRYDNPNDYIHDKILGGHRIYIKSSLVEDTDRIHVNINRKYSTRWERSDGKISPYKYKIYEFDGNWNNDQLINVKLTDVGNRYFTYNDFIVFKRPVGKNYFILLDRSKYNVIEHPDEELTSTWVQVELEDEPDLGDLFCVMNKNSYFNRRYLFVNSDMINYLVSSEGHLQIPLYVVDGGLNIPLPIESPHDVDIWVRGYHMININEESEYDTDYEGQYKLIRSTTGDEADVLSFDGIPLVGDILELETNVPYDSTIGKLNQYSKTVDSVSILDLRTIDFPLHKNYLDVYYNQRHLPSVDYKVTNQAFMFVNDVKRWTYDSKRRDNLEIRTRIMNSSFLSPLLALYNTSQYKSDLDAYLAMLSAGDFTTLMTSQCSPATLTSGTDDSPFLWGMRFDEVAYYIGSMIIGAHSIGTNIDSTNYIQEVPFGPIIPI